jgi:hypothetical protein
VSLWFVNVVLSSMVRRTNARASVSSPEPPPPSERENPSGHLRWLVELTDTEINLSFADTTKWVILTHRLATRVSVEAQIFIVKRARLIWGKFGSVLRKSSWAKAWREENLEPVYRQGAIKKWVPK